MLLILVCTNIIHK